MALTVSVALCTFQSERFIESQLTSVFGQDRRPDELVISDDGSTDATLDIVRRVVASHGGDVAVRIATRVDPVGVTRNFESAIQECTGDIIALCDHDDVWHPDRISAALAEFRDPAVELVHSNARLVDSVGSPTSLSLFDGLRVRRGERDAVCRGDAFSVLIRRNLVTGAATMVRRELALRAMPFPEQWVHDEWLGIIAAAFGGVRLLDRELIDYRQHGANQIGVAEPTLRRKSHRVFEPRGDRLVQLAERSAILAQRLERLLGRGATLDLAVAKAEFEKARAAYPRARVRRVLPVVKNWVAGDYGRFASQGGLDVVRDLVQPA